MIKCFSYLLLLTLSLPLFAQSKMELKVEKHLLAQDTSKAIKQLNKYITKHDQEVSLYLMRAKIKIERGDLDPAMADLNTFCSLQPNCGEASFLKGQIRYLQGDYSGCLTHFDAAVGSKFEEQALVYKGLAYMWLYQSTHAQQTFDKALEKHPQSVELLYNASLLAYRSEKYDEANGYINRLLAVAPDDADARLTKALIQTKRKEYVASNLLLREMLKVDDENPSINYSIVVNYYHLDERDLACDYFRRARDQGHDQAQMAIRNYCKGR
jgi:tetratricopeptide (TPR) repeat protein